MKQFTLLALALLLSVITADTGNSKQFLDTIGSAKADKAVGLLDPKSLTKCAGEIDRSSRLQCFDDVVAAWGLDASGGFLGSKRDRE